MAQLHSRYFVSTVYCFKRTLIDQLALDLRLSRLTSDTTMIWNEKHVEHC